MESPRPWLLAWLDGLSGPMLTIASAVYLWRALPEYFGTSSGSSSSSDGTSSAPAWTREVSNMALMGVEKGLELGVVLLPVLLVLLFICYKLGKAAMKYGLIRTNYSRARMRWDQAFRAMVRQQHALKPATLHVQPPVASNGKFAGWVWFVPGSLWDVTHKMHPWPPNTEREKGGVALKCYAALEACVLTVIPERDGKMLKPVHIHLEGCTLSCIDNPNRKPDHPPTWQREWPLLLHNAQRPLYEGSGGSIEHTILIFVPSGAFKEQWYMALSTALGADAHLQSTQQLYALYSTAMQLMTGAPEIQLPDPAAAGLFTSESSGQGGKKDGKTGDAPAQGQHRVGWFGRLLGRGRGQGHHPNKDEAKNASTPPAAAPALQPAHSDPTTADSASSIAHKPATPAASKDGSNPKRVLSHSVSTPELGAAEDTDVPSQLRASSMPTGLASTLKAAAKASGPPPVPPPLFAGAEVSASYGVNMLLARLGFELLRSPQLTANITRSVQGLLDNIKLPPMFHPLKVSNTKLGHIFPQIKGAKAVASLANAGSGRPLWPHLLLDIVFSGDISMTVSTTVELQKQFEWLRLQSDDEAKAAAKDADTQSDSSHGAPLGLLGGLLALPKKIAGGFANSLSHKPVSVEAHVKRIEATFMIWMSPPPSDKLWIAFENAPKIDLAINPSIDMAVLNAGMRIALPKLLRGKILGAITQNLTFPACVDVSLNAIFAHKDKVADTLPLDFPPEVVAAASIATAPTPLPTNAPAQPAEAATGATATHSAASCMQLPQYDGQPMRVLGPTKYTQPFLRGMYSNTATFLKRNLPPAHATASTAATASAATPTGQDASIVSTSKSKSRMIVNSGSDKSLPSPQPGDPSQYKLVGSAPRRGPFSLLRAAVAAPVVGIGNIIAHARAGTTGKGKHGHKSGKGSLKSPQESVEHPDANGDAAEKPGTSNAAAAAAAATDAAIASRKSGNLPMQTTAANAQAPKHVISSFALPNSQSLLRQDSVAGHALDDLAMTDSATDSLLLQPSRSVSWASRLSSLLPRFTVTHQPANNDQSQQSSNDQNQPTIHEGQELDDQSLLQQTQSSRKQIDMGLIASNLSAKEFSAVSTSKPPQQNGTPKLRRKSAAQAARSPTHTAEPPLLQSTISTPNLQSRSPFTTAASPITPPLLPAVPSPGAASASDAQVLGRSRSLSVPLKSSPRPRVVEPAAS